MDIPHSCFDTIRRINVNAHAAEIEYGPWLEEFQTDRAIAAQIEDVRSHIGTHVRRSDIVRFYSTDRHPLTHFISAMIWGHAAAPGGSRDNRGPWKLSRMIYDSTDLAGDLAQIRIDTEENARRAYRLLASNRVRRLGPSFFTKHFYFIGKSRAPRRNYPVIFDNRVAAGLVQLASRRNRFDPWVIITAKPNMGAYFDYLYWVWDQAHRVSCAPDKIEMYLFDHMNRP